MSNYEKAVMNYLNAKAKGTSGYELELLRLMAFNSLKSEKTIITSYIDMLNKDLEKKDDSY